MVTQPINLGLGLYVHLPWCVRKCPYCDFNSHQKPAVLPEAAYVQALCRDLRQEAQRYIGAAPITSVFFGGGTPSLFSAAALAEILHVARECFAFAVDVEVTLEANPGAVEHDEFSAYREAGINRISLGVQSLDDSRLHKLGRVHSSADVYQAVDAMRASGFDNYNIDIMHGLPDQSLQGALADLQQACDLSPTHLSWYQLTIEPNTQFALKPPILPQEETLVDIESQGKRLLKQANYQQYEVSAYSLNHAYPCRHNLQYWQFGDYIGVGAGAHGKCTQPETGQIVRYWKQRHPKTYLAATSVLGGERELSAEELPLEFMLNACRLTQGFPLALFEMTTHLDRSVVTPALAKAQQQNLVVLDNGHVHLTAKGQKFLNTLLLLF